MAVAEVVAVAVSGAVVLVVARIVVLVVAVGGSGCNNCHEGDRSCDSDWTGPWREREREMRKLVSGRNSMIINENILNSSGQVKSS